MMIILPGLMWTVTVTLAVRPDITGSLMDINSIFPPSWEAVMLTFTTDEAMVFGCGNTIKYCLTQGSISFKDMEFLRIGFSRVLPTLYDFFSEALSSEICHKKSNPPD
jgi:hypothetical protein